MRHLAFAALLAIAGGHASSQPANCQDASPAACSGDQACITEARLARQQCLNANAGGAGVLGANGIGESQPARVPEPATAFLLGAGLLGLALALRKNPRKTLHEQAPRRSVAARLRHS